MRAFKTRVNVREREAREWYVELCGDYATFLKGSTILSKLIGLWTGPTEDGRIWGRSPISRESEGPLSSVVYPCQKTTGLFGSTTYICVYVSLYDPSQNDPIMPSCLIVGNGWYGCFFVYNGAPL